MKNLTILALVLSSSFAAAPAAAQERVVATVTTADLDLASQAGRKALDRRLTQAVIQVCGEASPADLAGQNDVRACRKRTRALAGAAHDRLLAAAARGGSIAVAAAR